MIRKRNVEFFIYVAGVFLFGLFYQPLKVMIQPPWLFLIAALGWIGFLRLAGALVSRKFLRDTE